MPCGRAAAGTNRPCSSCNASLASSVRTRSGRRPKNFLGKNNEHSPRSPGRPHPAPRAARAWRLSAEEVKKAVEPYEADQDEIDRDNIVQQPRHEQNQDAASESNERHQIMGDGGQPHGGGLLFFRVELPL